MRLRIAVAATVIAALALPGGAAATGFEDLYRDFKDDGAIDACRWSDRELRSAERDIPADVEQYAPAFGDQVAVARQLHARGECERGVEAAPVAGVPAPPAAEIPADTGVDVPLAVSLLGWLVIVAAVVAAIALTATRSERFRDLAREFWDWLRLGR